jgi:hypothetical protein
MASRSLFAALFIALLASPALAQNPPSPAPVRIRGTVERLGDHRLIVKSRGGTTVPITLAANFVVLAVEPETIADIKPGEMIGITSVKAAGGGQQAVEVHIFPKAMRGVRVGQFAWDLEPQSLMTNAMVATISGPPQGRVVRMSYGGKVTEITIPQGVPIVAFVPGSPSLLKPGAAVFVIAQKKPDGGLTAARVTAEKNGVKPPM